jgi:Domain of unknown function (DUF4203)
VADIVLGLITLLVGIALCLQGYLAMRIIIPLWGLFAGFVLGAGLVASFAGEGFLSSVLGWVVGALVGIAFGLLAYLFYEVSVFIAMSAIGFSLGTTVMVALGVEWSWLIILVGLLAGVTLALLAILADLPMVLLAVLTALAGAAVAVAGLMLLFGTVSTADLSVTATTALIADDWWWYALYLGFTVAGVTVQLFTATPTRGSLRQSWREAGGRQFRAA